MDGSRAILTAAILVSAATGCSSRPTPTDRRFDPNKWLFATIRDADRVALYEGLPHQFFEGNLLAEEKQSKPAVELHGYWFYAGSLDLKDSDRAKLVATLGSEESFAPLPDGVVKACGGFHPDFAVEWAAGDRVYRCLICFGCGEAKVFGPGGELHCDLVDRDPLKRVLVPYQKNRPSGEVWPPRIPAEPAPVPDRAGGK
jgi:hypothetical protein